MPVDPRHIVLYAVEQIGNRANGKTYVQKLCFFIAKLIHQPLGFRAHYYGPYSDQISAELAFLTGGGFLTETRRGSGVVGARGWEVARYDYSLTDKGKDAITWLNEKRPDEARLVREAITRILAAGDLDYVSLSFAAKTRWILDDSDSPMTPTGIATAAGKFTWNVTDSDVEDASAFLQALGLVEGVAEPTSSSQ